MRNPVIMGWKREMEELWKIPSARLRRTRASEGVTGYTFGADNVGAVPAKTNFILYVA